MKFQKGHIQPQEIREKISATKKARGWKPNAEQREKMSAAAKARVPWNKGLKYELPSCKGKKKGKPSWNKGVPMSEETRQKLSQSLLGRTTWNKGKKHFIHTEEWRKKVSAAHTGEKHWNWKGGITSENRIGRNSSSHKDWAMMVYRKDSFTCQHCGYKGREIVAHHICSFKEYPEMRYVVENGITLCRACHVLLHKPSLKGTVEKGLNSAKTPIYGQRRASKGDCERLPGRV